MSFAKIALFAFGLATVLVAGSVNADAAMGGKYSGWSNAYGSVANPGPTVPSAEELLFQRAKGGFN